MKYEELSDAQKSKALDQYRHINAYDGWDDELDEDFKEKMETFGFSDIEISSDTSFCQGSGASFTCDSIDIIKYLIGTKQRTKYLKLKQWIQDREITASIKRTGYHYNHSNTVDIDMEVSYNIDISPVRSELIGNLKKDIIDFVRTECDAFHRVLEKQYMEITSDKEVQESIIANEMDFAIKDTNVTYL